MKSALVVAGAAVILFIGMMTFRAMTRHQERPIVRPEAPAAAGEPTDSASMPIAPTPPDTGGRAGSDAAPIDSTGSADPADLVAQSRYVDLVGQVDRRVEAIVDDLRAAFDTAASEAVQRSEDAEGSPLEDQLEELRRSHETIMQQYSRAREQFSGVKADVNAITPPPAFSHVHSVWLNALREFDTGLDYMKTGYEHANDPDIERGNEHLLRYAELLKERARLMKAVSDQSLGERSD